MSTAIIGLGNIETRVAKNLAAGGENIIVADKTLSKAKKLAGELGGNAEAMWAATYTSSGSLGLVHQGR